MRQIREWMDDCGLRAKALHASKGSARNPNLCNGHYRRDYTSDWEYNRLAGVELIENRIDLAQALGAAEIVLHLYVPFMTVEALPEAERAAWMERFYGRVYTSLDALTAYGAERGVRICVENLFDMPGAYMVEIWERLLARYSAKALGICFDSGHANMVWGTAMTEVLARFGSRLYAMHLHDNTGTVDYHMLPGTGTIDWEKVMAALARTPYEGPLTLELSCPEADVDDYLRRAYQAGSRLTALFEKFRRDVNTMKK